MMYLRVEVSGQPVPKKKKKVPKSQMTWYERTGENNNRLYRVIVKNS